MDASYINELPETFRKLVLLAHIFYRTRRELNEDGFKKYVDYLFSKEIEDAAGNYVPTTAFNNLLGHIICSTCFTGFGSIQGGLVREGCPICNDSSGGIHYIISIVTFRAKISAIAVENAFSIALANLQIQHRRKYYNYLTGKDLLEHRGPPIKEDKESDETLASELEKFKL